jgi:ATP-dependent RNA helicase DDX49/DBP8
MGPHRVTSSSEERDLSGVESDSDRGSNASSNQALSPHDASNSDSDSLDSSSSRKRIRLSEDTAPRLPQTLAPSRVKIPQSHVANPVDANSSILAPTDANTTFESLNVKPWLVGSLKAMAIRRPTGIQKGCIPEILKGRDCIGGSRTGSGKTVAFSVPILQKWAEDPVGIFAVILTPTR